MHMAPRLSSSLGAMFYVSGFTAKSRCEVLLLRLRRRRSWAGRILAPVAVADAPAAQLVFEEAACAALLHTLRKLRVAGRCADLGRRAIHAGFRGRRLGARNECRQQIGIRIVLRYRGV